MEVRDAILIWEEMGAQWLRCTTAAIWRKDAGKIDVYLDDCVPDTMGEHEFCATISDLNTRIEYIRQLAETNTTEYERDLGVMIKWMQRRIYHRSEE